MAEETTTNQKKSPSLTPLAILLSGILIAVGIVVKDNPHILGEKYAKPAQVAQPQTPTPTPDTPKALSPFILDVETAGGPVMGNANAPVTLIEISDYECPYCKAHAVSRAGPQIKANYIDTGKVKLVFRDFPLSFHDPVATKEAELAECVRAQLGDTGYFKFHDKLFENTLGNGKGIEDKTLYDLVSQVGANSQTAKACLDGKQKSEEVKKDVAQIGEYGEKLYQILSERVAKGEEDRYWLDRFGLGTPSFFIGKSTSDGKIQGEFLSGAQDFTTFKQVIEKYLK